MLLNDVDAAIAEVRWAKDAGLMGVLLPSDHVLNMANLYYPKYESFWATCAEIDLLIYRHGVKPTESVDVGGPASPVVGTFEAEFYGTRAIAHLILAGVFERYPSLKFVTTEIKYAAELNRYLSQLDALSQTATSAVSAQALGHMTKTPSEYFASKCYLAGPFDLRTAYEAGVPNLMWGADLPHAEGTFPYTLEALRAVFAGLPKMHVQKMFCQNAVDVYGFDLATLQPVADRVGPTVDQLSQSLTPEETPRLPR